jgi:hypothetical protein
MYKRYGSKSRLYLNRFHISKSLMLSEDFSHDWLTEFAWKEIEKDHDLSAGLRAIKKRYEYLKRERQTVTMNEFQVLSD